MCCQHPCHGDTRWDWGTAVCSFMSCVLHSSAAERPLQTPAESETRNRGFARGPSLLEVPSPAVILSHAQASKWPNRHPLPLVLLGFVFISVKHSGLLYLTDSPSHTPLSPHRASWHFWLSGDSETLIFRRNTIPCSLTPHPCCLSALC